MKKIVIGIMLLAICTLNASAIAVYEARKDNADNYGVAIEEIKLINKNEMYQRLHELSKETEIQWINIIATAYTAAKDETPKGDGITASGRKVSLSRGTIAAPFDVPFFTRIMIPELGKEFTVEDRGNQQYIKRISQDTIRIDVYMKTKAEAKEFGVKKLKGYIVNQ